MDVARTRRRGRIAALRDVCDEDSNVVLILARMELERLVEDHASIEGQALRQVAEAAHPLIDVIGRHAAARTIALSKQALDTPLSPPPLDDEPGAYYPALRYLPGRDSHLLA
ncbi:hypothetical protein [Kribbella sp. VKM Ac-2568]|uniref:hypothetical protein n=1 Tax=Kribbella sp. VKM Ac-2568 TaxID=2512219 RepID=UPI001043F9D7|nr:hypothetical protein [Kribbella sp. VKM Ac-2568]TCM51386.1 hypothetical protein EV648_101222 [Kribbella sp. VKM Ac-2568]